MDAFLLPYKYSTTNPLELMDIWVNPDYTAKDSGLLTETDSDKYLDKTAKRNRNLHKEELYDPTEVGTDWEVAK